MDLHVVPIDMPEDVNLILGQAHFIKTVEDLHETLAQSSPVLRFGVAFCESSGPRLIRRSGNDQELVELAVGAAREVGAGRCFAASATNFDRAGLAPVSCSCRPAGDHRPAVVGWPGGVALPVG